MVTATFRTDDMGRHTGFCIGGHAGHGVEGNDIVCAAVSAMTMFCINLISETFGVDSATDVDESEAVIDFSLSCESDVASSVLRGFCAELLALESDYPDNIRVITE